MMEKINFEWVRGDDEFETLAFTQSDAPVDFTGVKLDLHIKPSIYEAIKLSSESGGLIVNGNEITLHVKHTQTEQAKWSKAKWDLQQTTADGLVKTLCCGEISLKHDVTRLFNESQQKADD